MPRLHPLGYLVWSVFPVLVRLCDWVGRAVGCVASLAAMTATQRGAFRVSSNLISLCPVSDICGIFSNWVLSSNSGSRPRETTMSRLFVETLQHP